MEPINSRPPDDAELRRVFGCFPSGVIAVCATIDGEPVGMAASSFTSGFGCPAVGVDLRAEHLDHLAQVAAARQAGGQCAGRGPRRGLPEPVAQGRRPVRRGALDASSPAGRCSSTAPTAWLDCRLHSELPAGDHTIALLEICGLSADPGTPPLVFHGSRFHRLADGRRVEGARMRTTDVRVRRAIAAVGGRPSRSSSPTTRTAQGYVVFAAEAATPETARLHRPAYLGLCPRRTAGQRVRPADLPPMCHARPMGVAADRVAVDWCGNGTGISATDRAGPLRRSLRRRRRSRPTSGARVTWFRYGPATTGCWDCRDRPRQRWIWPGLRAGDRQERCARSSPADPSPRWPVAPSWSSSPTGTRLSMVSIADLVAYRRRTEPQVVRSAETICPSRRERPASSVSAMYTRPPAASIWS